MVVLDTGVVVVNPTTGAGLEETKELRQDEQPGDSQRILGKFVSEK